MLVCKSAWKPVGRFVTGDLLAHIQLPTADRTVTDRQGKAAHLQRWVTHFLPVCRGTKGLAFRWGFDAEVEALERKDESHPARILDS